MPWYFWPPPWGLPQGLGFLTGDPIRAVAVLVVATPCPLILAVPVAWSLACRAPPSTGFSSKAEKLSNSMVRVRVVVIDKTGTLTEGRPALKSAAAVSTFATEEILRVAASLDQASKHTIAHTIVAEAHRRDLVLSVPSRITEAAGEGIEGDIDGRHVVIGGRRFVAKRLGLAEDSLRSTAVAPGSVTVAVAVDGQYAGELVFAEELRAGTEPLLSGLCKFGVKRIVLATGDRRDVAESVTAK